MAPGRLVEEREADGRYVARFAFDKPARELTVFVGPYVVGETMHGPLRLRTYFPKEQAELGERYRRQVARYIDGFSAAIGPYPHSEFHVVASPLPVGLGFPTLTYVSRQILHLPFMQERSLAHEVLHAWWGLAVAVDYERGNWSEALTTFMADYAHAEAAGDAPAREMRRRWLSDFAVLPGAQDQPVTAFRSPRPRGLAGDRLQQGRDAVPHAARRDRRGRIRGRHPPLLARAAIQGRGLARAAGRVRSGGEAPARYVLPAMARAPRRAAARAARCRTYAGRSGEVHARAIVLRLTTSRCRW